VIGYVGTGIAFVMLGSADPFRVAALSQVLYGVSATFDSVADVAWLTDEVGEDAARPLYVRSEQFFNGGALAGIAGSVALASIALRLPILVCGLGYAALGVTLAFGMTESGAPPVTPGRSSDTRCAPRCGMRSGRSAHITSCC
jgi:MFS transporter, DHA3 family, tetracycline resistance protein